MNAIQDDIVDVLKLAALVNNEGRLINQSLTEGNQQMGFRRVVPKMEDLIGARKTAEPEVAAVSKLPPPLPPPLPQDGMPPPLPTVMLQPPTLDSQKEFGFVEKLMEKPDILKVLIEINNSLKNIEYKLDIYNKTSIEILKQLPKKRKTSSDKND